MSKEFVHLHLHTDYSMLDGACKISKLAKQAAQFGMKALAITDHGNMHGSFEFYHAMKKEGIKPIMGCEFYVAPESLHEKSQRHSKYKGYHQVLFARNQEGFQNLCRLNAIAHMQGFYYNPRIDKEVLAQNSKGLFGTSTCIGSEVNQYLMADNVKMAKQIIDDYVQILGPENYALELQDHGMSEQHKCNKYLVQLAKEFNLRLVATNDSHYLCKDHAKAHDTLLCIGTGRCVHDEKRMRFPSEEFYLKSPEEMYQIFKEVPESLTNTLAIAEMCEFEFEEGVNHYPVFNPECGTDRDEFILKLCKDALIERFDLNLYNRSEDSLTGHNKVIVDRMHYELGIIKRMGFISYFLCVWDFLHFARQRDIPVGPGRGSGAGSLVAFLLKITDVDPLKYGLLFERFLNPDRVSPPDFDIDLCERRRGEVIEYVRDKYGEERVAQICTFGTLKAKAVLKDVARAMGHPFENGNRLTKMVPEGPKVNLSKALDESKEFQQAYSGEAWVKEVVDTAKPLEGLNRNLSIHACGLIIGDQPLTNLIPLARGAGNEQITQYPAVPCEDLGLLKMDFLGLKTLTIIKDACEFAKGSQGVEIDPDTIPIDDKKCYELLSSGHTVCVFQLESGGMQDLCRRWHVESIHDVSALLALYRPGPMQFIEPFLARKMGEVPVEYLVPEMEEILKETYGFMIYQEQVMQVAQKVAGFSLGGADILRRAMGKKKADVMAQQLEVFVEGAKKNGHSESKAKEIWDQIETFAGYGFNKSHSAAYAFLSIRTAYMKANYPVEFMAANLCMEIGKADRIAELTSECRRMKIRVLPPDVNISRGSFTVDGDNIRFGLAAIKGCGDAAADAIIGEREKDGPFKTLEDFCERVGSQANRRVIESLAQCGAFDCFGHKRSQIVAIIDELISRAQQKIRDKESGQGNFFDMMLGGEDDAANDGLALKFPDIPEWPFEELLANEKMLLGFYVSGHPLDTYQEELEKYAVHRILDIQHKKNDNGIRIGGLITMVMRKLSKRDGRPWAIIGIEDMDSSIECLMFSDAYEKYGEYLQEDAVILMEGHISIRDEEESATVIVQKVVPLKDAPEHYASHLHVPIYQDKVNSQDLTNLQELLRREPGETEVILSCVLDNNKVAFVQTGASFKVSPKKELVDDICQWAGKDKLIIKPNRKVADRESRRRFYPKKDQD